MRVEGHGAAGGGEPAGAVGEAQREAGQGRPRHRAVGLLVDGLQELAARLRRPAPALGDGGRGEVRADRGRVELRGQARGAGGVEEVLLGRTRLRDQAPGRVLAPARPGRQERGRRQDGQQRRAGRERAPAPPARLRVGVGDRGGVARQARARGRDGDEDEHRQRDGRDLPGRRHEQPGGPGHGGAHRRGDEVAPRPGREGAQAQDRRGDEQQRGRDEQHRADRPALGEDLGDARARVAGGDVGAAVGRVDDRPGAGAPPAGGLVGRPRRAPRPTARGGRPSRSRSGARGRRGPARASRR